MKRKTPRFALLFVLIGIIAFSGAQLCFADKEATEDEVLSVINKWHSDLYANNYQLLLPVYIAGLMDPVPYQVVEELKLKNFSTIDAVTDEILFRLKI